MNAPDYFKEHKKLIALLLTAHKKEFIKEAKNQIKEVKAQKKLIKTSNR